MNRSTSLAVVLRRWPYSENSQVVHLLTPETGLQPVLAKGVHKLTSGRAGVLDTFSLVRVATSQRRESDLRLLLEAELLDRFPGLSRRVDALNAAGLLAELAELAAPTEQPSGPVFLFLVSCLQELDAGADVPSLLARRIFEALGLLGLQPDLGPASLAAPAWFSIAAGRLLDPTEPRPDGPAVRIDPDQHAALRRYAAAGAQDARADASSTDACLTMLGRFLAYHLERPPRAWQALEARRAPARNPT